MKKLLKFFPVVFFSIISLINPAMEVQAQACSTEVSLCPENNCHFDCGDWGDNICDVLNCTPGENTCICSEQAGSICQEDYRCEAEDPNFPDIGWCTPCDIEDCASYDQSCVEIPCCFDGERLFCDENTQRCDFIIEPTCLGHGTPCGEDEIDPPDPPTSCCDPYQCTANPYGEYYCHYAGEICERLAGNHPNDGCRDSCNEDDQRSIGELDCPVGQECCVYASVVRRQRIFCDENGLPTREVTARINTAIGCIPANDMRELFNFIVVRELGIAGGIAFILIVYAGIMITTSGGDPRKVQAGKELMSAAISGLAFLALGLLVLEYIGVDILNIPEFGR